MDLLRTCLIAVSLLRGIAGYETYFVERDCQSGKLTVQLLGPTGPMSSVLIRATERTHYSLAMQCTIMLFAPANHEILVSIRELGFRTRPDGTCRDYFQIERPMCNYINRVDEERHYYSSNNTLKMLYYTAQEGLDNKTYTTYPGIKLTVTAYTKGVECVDEFTCKNKHCIWSGLTCDSHNNCGDLSDEEDCGSKSGGNSMVLIILGVLILVLLLIMCMATLLCSKNESVRRFSNRLRSRTLSYMPKFSK